MHQLRRYLVTGLVLWVPLGITIWVLTLIVSTLDKSLLLIPYQYRPEALLGFTIPGLGVVLTFIILIVTGVLTRNFVGQKLVRAWDSILRRIPVVKSIYSGVKQVSDTLFSDTGQAFRKALLIEFPSPGNYTIAFMTGTPSGEVLRRLPGDHVSVYVPTTPNPTSGYFLLVPKNKTQELDMSVDEALKYIVSMGVVGPPHKAAPGAAAAGGIHAPRN
ncbi:MAG: DUF502 domain-containing protein [Betaproteobacteria bacterium]|nr:DUF502 domain-containing protein [Betaproteobacteria bacterium]MBK9606040.1 DUF502 domain-containing protein [Betaproteobacteria bacterium]